MKQLSIIGVLLLLAFCSAETKAQKTQIYNDPEHLYKMGLELFDKKQFAAAQKSFYEYSQASRSQSLKADAAYYSAACGIELFNKDSEWLMRQFISDYAWNTHVNDAYFYLAKSNYRKKKYSEAIEYFDKIELQRLLKDDQPELRFKRGYSYFITGNDEKAKADFFEIKDKDSKYASAALYYYSHISYKQKNYEIALQGFNKLVKDETFGPVVPYYITQIYFIQGKYDRVVKEAPKLLKDSINIQKEGEINRMIGESYFNQKDFSNALTFLKKTELGSGLNQQGNYVLGFCSYKNKDYTGAINNFQKAVEGKDSIAQNAWYHMADCYIKIGEKLKAKNAFYSAYQIDFDKKITEDALFSFAKLSYELDFSPYNEAVKGLNKYLKEYPQSQRREECYNLLINVYSTSKNYEQAIQSIESMQTVDPVLKYTYQKLIYFRGVELFNNGDLDNAEKQFKKSLAQNSDFKLNGLSQYWLAEISFNRKDYNTAIDAWKKFQVTQGATQLPEYDLSNYALGYAYLQRHDKDDYTNANIAFRKFLLTKNKYDENKMVDANLRVADCYQMNLDLAQASDYYKIVIAANKLDVDYALFQKSRCDGARKNYTEKLAGLQKIENSFPGSDYMAATILEIAETYHLNLNDDNQAIVYYEKVLKNYPNSTYASSCYAQIGNIYYNRNQDDKAFEFFDKFVKIDSKSEAAKEVLKSIKKIFEEKGDLEGMKKYFESIGDPLDDDALELSTYKAANKAYYEDKNTEAAMPLWESYIKQFPNGKHISEAQFCYAECAYGKGLAEKALPGYLFIIQRPRSLNTELALTRASYMYYKDKKYQEALPLFLQLQEVAENPANKTSGRFGAMRCSFYLNQYETSLTESGKVLNNEKLSPQQQAEAKYIKARSLYETGRLEDAMTEFKSMTKTSKNVTGAEAYYYIAKIQFKKGDYKEVEKTVNKLVSYEYTNDDWNNKALLLQADAYLAKGEDADARVMLETIIEGKPKQEYLDEATKKLEELNAKEAAAKKKLEEQKAPVKEQLQLAPQTNATDSTTFNQLIGEPPAPVPAENNQSDNPQTPQEQPKADEPK